MSTLGVPVKLSGYSNTNTPVGLRNEIEKLLKNLDNEGIDLGYKTVAEFVKEAARHRVEQPDKSISWRREDRSEEVG